MMGFSGRFVYSRGAWHEDIRNGVYLAVEIHDSDLALIRYSPSLADGFFFLSVAPVDYFADDGIDIAFEADTESAALARWTVNELGIDVSASEVAKVMTSSGGADTASAVFVEELVVALLDLLSLPLPPVLARMAGTDE